MTRSLRRVSCLALALGAALALAPALRAETPSPRFEGQTSVTLVEIPVEVERGGKAVEGLSAADFAVTTDGRPLPIVAFEPIELAPAPAGTATTASAPPPAGRRHLFLLFDFAFSRSERLADGVAAARRLVASGLDPTDQVGVGIYLPTGRLPLLLHPTADRAAAERALASLAALLSGQPVEPAEGSQPDPLRLTGGGVPALLSLQTDVRNTYQDTMDSLAAAYTYNRGGAPDLQYNILGHSSMLTRASVQGRQRSDVKGLIDGFSRLAEVLGQVRGRRVLAFFSEGFPVTIASPGAGGSTWIGRTSGTDLLVHVDRALKGLRRDGWVVHAIDIAGTREAGLFGDGGLFTLAADTGGTLIAIENDLAAGLGRALAPSLHAYLLTVQASDVAPDGAFHPLEVRLAGAGRGVKLRHRTGFRSELPYASRPPSVRLAEASALVASGEERDELGVTAMAVPVGAGTEPGGTRVAVLVEVPGEALGEGDGGIELETYGYAIDDAGASRDFFGYAVDLDRAEVAERLAAGGVRVLGELDLAPGRYGIRVFVRDRLDGRTALRTVPLVLGDGAPSERLAAFFLAGEGDPWLPIPAGGEVFVVRGRSVLPATRATVREGGEAQVLLLGSGLTGRHAVLSQVVDAAGRPVAGGGLELLGLSAGSDAEPDVVVGRLRAGTLPPGAYALEVRLAGDTPAGRSSTRRFEVVASTPPALERGSAGPTGAAR